MYKIRDYVKFNGIQKVGMFTTPLIQNGYIQDVVIIEGVLFFAVKADSGLEIQVSYPDIISVVKSYPYKFNEGVTVRFIGTLENKPVIEEGKVISSNESVLTVLYDAREIQVPLEFVVGV